METGAKERGMISLLLVDDEDSFRLIVQELLTSHGKYKVYASESGEEAIVWLQQRRVDVVILDYKMPGMSGLNVLQWMHEQKIRTPVIMLTAAGSETIAVEAMKLGAYDYIRKDQFDKDHLPIIINGVHERYLFRREKEQRETVEFERLKHFDSLRAFLTTLTAISEIVNSALLVVNGTLERHEKELQPFVVVEGRGRLKDLFMRMRQEYVVVSSAMKSVLNIVEVLRANITDDRASSRLRGTLENVQAGVHDEVQSTGSRQP